MTCGMVPGVCSLVEPPDNMRTTAFPGLRAGGEADARRVADRVVGAWREIHAVLLPIIGQRGVLALYDRTLHLVGASHPWLMESAGDAAALTDLVFLGDAFAQQSAVDAADAGDALINTFNGLLISLIGAELTEKLLHSVWEGLSHGSPTQDTSP